MLSLHFESFNKECVTIKEVVEPGNKTKGFYFAAEFVSVEIAYSCFKEAVISKTLVNFTAKNFLGHTEYLQEFGMQ